VGDTGGVLTVVVGCVVVLIAVGVVHDLVAKRRGRYRPAKEWSAISRRRRSHFRRGRAGDARPKSEQR
jgi:hypothetical protein